MYMRDEEMRRDNIDKCKVVPQLNLLWTGLDLIIPAVFKPTLYTLGFLH
jgi:hypothetical protein